MFGYNVLMLLLKAIVNEDDIEVNQDSLVRRFMDHLVHCVLEASWRIRIAKTNYHILLQYTASAENCFAQVNFFDMNEVVPVLEV